MIKPEQIERKQFTVRKLKGYDPDEVDAFLDAVVKSYREVLAELSRSIDTVQRLRDNQVTQVIPPVIGDVTRLLSVAQQTADQTIADANGQAGSIVSDARKEATDIVEAGHEQRKIRITQLEDQRLELQQHVDAMQKAMEAARGRMQGALAELGDGPV